MNRRKLLSRRRGPEGEEDEELGAEEDSLTDDSGLSESEREEDAGTDGTLSEEEGDDLNEEIADKGNTVGKGGGKAKFVQSGYRDTDAMMNGVRGVPDAEEVDFSQMEDDGGAQKDPLESQETGTPEDTSHESIEQESQPRQVEERLHETPDEKRRREHEEYRKRRDADPTFIPNRGAFYLHDHRHSEGFRPFMRGGSRGGRGWRFSRYAFSITRCLCLCPDFLKFPCRFSFKWGLIIRDSDYMAQNTPVDHQWQHDMHEETHTDQRRSLPHHNHLPFAPNNRQRSNGDPPRSFGRTVYKGNVQIQVNLPGMKAPIIFSEVPSKVYTRLPYHRPPLRRDKPVRIALPDAPVRYIYPSPARSFIFIPRAMRPGGSGYIRGGGGRGRSLYSQGRSVYGGSTGYSPSVGMSRRSSLQFEHKPQFTPSTSVPAQTHQAAPAGTVESSSRLSVAEEEPPAKPVVRLPIVPQQAPVAHQLPPQSMMPQHPPQAPTPKVVPQHPPPSYTPNPIAYREHRATPKIPMHQPRPQKAVNVAEIDSPAVMHFPQSYNGHIYPESIPTPGAPQNMYVHSRQPSYPSQPSGTPLPHIPEAAVHARSFHPAYPSQGAYYPYPPQPHPVAQMHPIHTTPSHHDPRAFHPPPPYVPSGPSPMPNGAPSHYAMIPTQQQSASRPVPVTTAPPAGPTTIAQESNGMVYYSTWDPNQYYPYASGGSAGYPGTPGMPITPAPDGAVNSGSGTTGPVYFYPGTHTPLQHPIYYAQ